MTEKAFRFGFLIGRFQFVHEGHARLIESALALCEHVLVVVGSAQASGTKRNPFSAKLRESWLRQRYGDRIHTLLLPDYTNEGDHSFEWGAYLLQAVRHYGAAQEWPALDLIVEGEESGRDAWFMRELVQEVGRLIVPRPEEAVSATRIRRAITGQEPYDWQAHVHPALHEAYAGQRDYLIKLEQA
ncbi:nicotinamide-nucleotide adenylyltransferase [Paenibacillus phyllosphaerae]|uniref:Nicotinamide-nucleotide adenylyltransferase n=1 Tax=Paenibacillus phyllosphaerae TaxID=274593 RepID=A0A7W5B261_9BACL|nr:adenylyltransferase/cytidyltransferase family protein [Paenibacillus phyllosphaerae]MBB3112296.1 nicotinamide-nucleotide adenylyltransferase [Paenibacillus phyllosphaerae]